MANENRLIDADAIPFFETYVPDGDVQWEYKQAFIVEKETIDQMPTVDAVEVVHGRWETTEVTEDWETVERYHHFHRECKYSYCDNGLSGHPYCPNCGAKMDGDGDA